jgi:hypothetical protein
MTPEAKAKKKVKQLLEDYKAYYVMSVTGGFGRSGAPDITGCSKGRYFGIEVKADTNVTPLQEKNLRLIREAGGFAIAVRISSDGVVEGMEELENFLKEQ